MKQNSIRFSSFFIILCSCREKTLVAFNFLSTYNLMRSLVSVDVFSLVVMLLLTVDYIHVQAQIMLSEIYPGGSPKVGSTYWDQIHEVGVISVLRRVLKRLYEFLEQVRI